MPDASDRSAGRPAPDAGDSNFSLPMGDGGAAKASLIDQAFTPGDMSALGAVNPTGDTQMNGGTGSGSDSLFAGNNKSEGGALTAFTDGIQGTGLVALDDGAQTGVEALGDSNARHLSKVATADFGDTQANDANGKQESLDSAKGIQYASLISKGGMGELNESDFSFAAKEEALQEIERKAYT